MDKVHTPRFAPNCRAAVLSALVIGATLGAVWSSAASAAGTNGPDYTAAQESVAEICQAYDQYGKPITDTRGRPVTHKSSATCRTAGYIHEKSDDARQEDSRRGSFTN
ncbi:MAG: hypothetical protein ACR2PM_03710 [Hyphomicrobiales bacterium]